MLYSTILWSLLFCANCYNCVSLGSDNVAREVAGEKSEEHDASKARTARKEELHVKWGEEWSFSGVSTFAHLPHAKCLLEPDELYDIAIIGVPFDTAVSYRPGARFGPRALRAASARQKPDRGYNPRAKINPFSSWAKILDCGDIPVTPFDNAVALEQMTEGLTEILTRQTYSSSKKAQGSDVMESRKVPRFLSLGGDHAIALAALRALSKVYGQVAVVHFDAHLDTWHPNSYPSAWSSKQAQFNHGSMFWLASVAYDPPLILPNSSVHAGLRTRLGGVDERDYQSDDTQGWTRIMCDDIDEIGVKGVIEKIVSHVGTEVPVYLSIDIDVIDSSLCPATGTPEPGGWTNRELIQIIRGLEDLNIVAGDLVEVSPAYDGPGEQTALAGAQLVYEMLTNMVKREVKMQMKRDKEDIPQGKKAGRNLEGDTIKIDEGVNKDQTIKDEL